MRKLLSLPVAVAFAMISHAQITVTKDTSFGNNGTVTLQTGLPIMSSHILLIPNINLTFQDTGKIFAGYPYNDPSDPNNTLKSQFVRLNPDGSPDATFGSNGIIKLPDFEPYYFYANSNFFYLQANKKILSNGQPDTNFVSAGMQNVADWVYKTVLADGKIFLRADSSFNKFLADGTSDPSYGANGHLGIGSPIAGDGNNTMNYDLFFSRNNFVYEFIYPSPGLSNVRKINVDAGNLDSSYGVNGYAQVKSSGIPSSATYGGGVPSPQNDGSFVNKFTDGNNLYFTKTDPSGNINNGFGNSGTITGSLSFTNNGNTYSGSSMQPLVYSNTIIMPAEYTDSQGNTMWGISGYTVNGTGTTVNGSTFYPLLGISYESLGYVLAKDNYLYAIHDNNITRYIVQQPASTLGLSSADKNGKDKTISFNNPFNEELSLVSDEKIRKVEIKDQAGRTVMTGNHDKLDTSALVKGNYIIFITTENGKNISLKGIKL